MHLVDDASRGYSVGCHPPRIGDGPINVTHAVLLYKMEHLTWNMLSGCKYKLHFFQTTLGKHMNIESNCSYNGGVIGTDVKETASYVILRGTCPVFYGTIMSYVMGHIQYVIDKSGMSWN